jgi:SOS-response transcriptional repressor LexA
MILLYLIFPNMSIHKYEISDNIFMAVSGEKIVFRIDGLLEMKDLTRADACRYAKINPGAMTDWAKKGTIPAADTLLSIAKYLQTTVEYLLTDKPPEGIPPETLETARKIAALDPKDRQDILDFIGIKLKKTEKGREPMEALSVMEPEPAYTPDISQVSIHEEVIDNVIFYDWKVIDIPMVGSTAAGRPVDFGDLDPNPPTQPWAAGLISGNPKSYYCVLVRGTSMTEADIKDGDYALLKHAGGAENGEIMLVRQDNSSTLKRIKVMEGPRGREEVYICWEDGSGKKVRLEGEGVEIQGKLAAIERKPRKR